MKKYRNYLLENADSTRHVATAHGKIGDMEVIPGDVYYTNEMGNLHRLDGPALLWTDGSEHWFENGVLHRIGGPAIDRNDGFQQWYVNGKMHRLDGPAHIPSPGRLNKEWYINGDKITPYMYKADREFKVWQLLKANIDNNLPILNKVGMTKEQQEYILKHRPDLASKIENLDPELKAKYQHEVGLGHVDL